MPKLYMLLVRDGYGQPRFAFAPPTKPDEPWMFTMSEVLGHFRTYARSNGVENVRLVMDVKVTAEVDVRVDGKDFT